MPPSKVNSMIMRIQNKMKTSNENFNKELEELDEVVSKLKKEYMKSIKTETQAIIIKYDGLINEIVEQYNSYESNENTNTTERDEKLKVLYNKRDTELIEIKIKYIQLAEQDKKSKKGKNENVELENESAQSNLTSIESYEMSQNNLGNTQNPNIYVTNLIHKKISVPFCKIGNNMNEYFKKYSEINFEGKCHKEGYIKPFSTSIVSYTTGLLKFDNVIYDVVYSVDICFPYENMEVVCKIKNITKIGIRGVISDEYNPIILFISREHNATKNFDDYEEGQLIKVKIIGHRFEKNDEHISVIGEII